MVKLGVEAPPPKSSVWVRFGGAALAIVPLTAVVLVAIVGYGRWQEMQQHHADIYARAETALEAGDFDAAALGFEALGGYRDAETRLEEVREVSKPVRDQMDRALSAFAEGDTLGAIALLESIVAEAPGFTPARDLLESTRAARVEQLRRDASFAQANRDWLRAELALRELTMLEPDDADAAEALASVVRDHAPLVFVREGALYLAGPDGTLERAMTSSVGATYPSWSPDRTQIAFVSATDPDEPLRGDLLVIDVMTGTTRTIASDVMAYSWPMWSPDGSSIAYSSMARFDSNSLSGTVSLHVYSLDTGVDIDLTGDQLPHAATPSWSPDGAEIVFVSSGLQRRAGGGVMLLDGDVYVVPASGGVARNLTNQRIVHESWVQWSPAGGRILIFTAPGDWAAPAKSRMYLLDLVTNELVEIAVDEWQVSLPFWSPDGSRIAYITGGDTVTFWSDAGREWIRLDDDVGSFVTWSPDGRYVIVPPVDDAHPAYVVTVDGTFGTIAAFDLDLDDMRSAKGPPVWGGLTPLSVGPTAER